MTSAIFLIILGRGEMAKDLVTLCKETKIDYWHLKGEEFKRPQLEQKYTFSKHSGFAKKVVCVHFGSGQYLKEFILYAKNAGAPLIQGSTGQTIPSNITTPIINAPNLALPIVRLFGIIPYFKTMFGDSMQINITESHQASKKSVAGTARHIAELLNVPVGGINSIRNPETQKTLLNIPIQHLDGHACHWITLVGGGVEIELSTEIHGRRAYSEGAVSLAKMLVLNRATVKNKIYQVSEFFQGFTWTEEL